MNFVHFPSLIVTLCGSLFAVLITADSFGDYISSLGSFIQAFQKPSVTVNDISEQILSMSDVSRKEGLLSLDEQIQQLLIMEVITEGVLSIQAGENPRIIKEKIKSILTFE